MTDMSDWTEAETTEYLNMLRRVARHDNPTAEELSAMSIHGKEEMVEMYKELLYPKKTWYERLKGVIKFRSKK